MGLDSNLNPMLTLTPTLTLILILTPTLTPTPNQARFVGRGLLNNPPHIYAIAEEAVRKATPG